MMMTDDRVENVENFYFFVRGKLREKLLKTRRKVKKFYAKISWKMCFIAFRIQNQPFFFIDFHILFMSKVDLTSSWKILYLWLFFSIFTIFTLENLQNMKFFSTQIFLCLFVCQKGFSGVLKIYYILHSTFSRKTFTTHNKLRRIFFFFMINFPCAHAQIFIISPKWPVFFPTSQQHHHLLLLWIIKVRMRFKVEFSFLWMMMMMLMMSNRFSLCMKMFLNYSVF